MSQCVPAHQRWDYLEARIRNPKAKIQRFLYVGGLAQLARAPALQAGGQRFESVILHSGRRRAFQKPSDSKTFYDILHKDLN